MNFLKQYIVELAPTKDQHWYSVWRKKEDGSKGIFIGNFPSVTTHLNAYPTSKQLQEWIGDNGWNESQRIKSLAGRRGTNTHTGIEDLLNGAELQAVGFDLFEWDSLFGFCNWFEDYKPKVIAIELPIFSEQHGYAGRADGLYLINNEIVLPDNKTSRNMHKSFWLQFAAYANAVEEMTDVKIDRTATIKLGVAGDKHYRFIYEPQPWREAFEVYLAVKKTWEYDTEYEEGKSAPVLSLPLSLKLNLNA